MGRSAFGQAGTRDDAARSAADPERRSSAHEHDGQGHPRSRTDERRLSVRAGPEPRCLRGSVEAPRSCRLRTICVSNRADRIRRPVHRERNAGRDHPATRPPRRGDEHRSRGHVHRRDPAQPRRARNRSDPGRRLQRQPGDPARRSGVRAHLREHALRRPERDPATEVLERPPDRGRSARGRRLRDRFDRARCSRLRPVGARDRTVRGLRHEHIAGLDLCAVAAAGSADVLPHVAGARLIQPPRPPVVCNLEIRRPDGRHGDRRQVARPGVPRPVSLRAAHCDAALVGRADRRGVRALPSTRPHQRRPPAAPGGVSPLIAVDGRDRVPGRHGARAAWGRP